MKDYEKLAAFYFNSAPGALKNRFFEAIKRGDWKEEAEDLVVNCVKRFRRDSAKYEGRDIDESFLIETLFDLTDKYIDEHLATIDDED